MLQSVREETEGKLQMLLSLRKNGLTSLFKEVSVSKALGSPTPMFCKNCAGAPPTPMSPILCTFLDAAAHLSHKFSGTLGTAYDWTKKSLDGTR